MNEGYSWVLFALFSGLLSALVNILDKYVLDKFAKNPVVPILLLGIFNLLPCGLILAIRGIPRLSLQNSLLIVVAGVAIFYMAYFYFKAAALEEISRVVPLLFLSPLFTAVLAFIFLDETFTYQKYLGVFAVILGALLVSSRFPLAIRISRPLWFMIISALSISVHYVLAKYLLGFADYWSVFALTRLVMSAATIPLFFRHASDLKSTLEKHSWKVVGVMALDQYIALGAILLLFVAAAGGPISLVMAVASIQPFFVLLFTVLLSLFWPQLMKEGIARSTVLQKMAAIVLMFAGILLITG
ncbi:MAG: EamA family transporter [Candidatus Aminicenantes bacterium]|nr:EamA family transporter [Candidatus Aminicenantes bacterium]